MKGRKNNNKSFPLKKKNTIYLQGPRKELKKENGGEQADGI